MIIDNWKTGDKFIAKIRDVEVEGKIYITGAHIFLCQNTFRGMPSPDKLGYDGSWIIHISDVKYDKVPYLTNLKVFNTLNRKERIQNLSL